MNITVLAVNGIALSALTAAFIRDRKRAAGALKMAGKMFISILPMFIIIILLIGILFGFVPEERLEHFLGKSVRPSGNPGDGTGWLLSPYTRPSGLPPGGFAP